MNRTVSFPVVIPPTMTSTSQLRLFVLLQRQWQWTLAREFQDSVTMKTDVGASTIITELAVIQNTYRQVKRRTSSGELKLCRDKNDVTRDVVVTIYSLL